MRKRCGEEQVKSTIIELALEKYDSVFLEMHLISQTVNINVATPCLRLKLALSNTNQVLRQNPLILHVGVDSTVLLHF